MPPFSFPSNPINHQQNEPPKPYNPTLHPPSFQPPPAHHILQPPTLTHPGFSTYAHNPFAPPPPPPRNRLTLPSSLRNPSAFYTAHHYREEPTPDPQAARAATPAPHTLFAPKFGVSGFTHGVHALAYTPLQGASREGMIGPRAFGYQPRPAFPGAVFHPASKEAVAEEKRKKALLLPSERVRRQLEGIVEEDEERARKKRKRSLTPSQKVRKRLQRLGPREAWDPDSP